MRLLSLRVILIIEGSNFKNVFFGISLDHPSILPAIKLQPGTSGVLYNPISEAMKDMRVLDTLKFILDS